MTQPKCDPGIAHVPPEAGKRCLVYCGDFCNCGARSPNALEPGWLKADLERAAARVKELGIVKYDPNVEKEEDRSHEK